MEIKLLLQLTAAVSRKSMYYCLGHLPCIRTTNKIIYDEPVPILLARVITLCHTITIMPYLKPVCAVA